jgi:Ca2+-binding RTX toxin-like protein
LAFTTVRSATGVDFIGTPGVDVGALFDESGKVMITGLGDADVIQISNSTGIQRTTSVNGGDGADLVAFFTNISDSSINGNMGADTINFNLVFGGSSVSNSTLGGGEGDDQILGGRQFLASLVNGGAGNDTLQVAVNLALASINGGDGNDVINVFSSFAPLTGQTLNTSSINGNAGNDVINGVGFNATVSGVNFIGGGAGDDTIDFTNATTDNFAVTFARGFDLTGGSGSDLINGSRENDAIWGNADNDTIFGNEGRDSIYAGAGNDTITVGRLFGLAESGDVITGGAGADIFNKAVVGSTATFVINGIAESAAATSGTARTFDSFAPYGAFVGGASGDILNISAVTNQLAGGVYTGAGGTNPILAGAFAAGVFTDFAGLKGFLDTAAFAHSDVNSILAYNFTATIAGVAGNYLWIQDSQRQYSSSDLLFQTTGAFIPTTQITLI